MSRKLRRCCRRLFPRSCSISSPPTCVRKSSISGCRRRSTSAPSAMTGGKPARCQRVAPAHRGDPGRGRCPSAAGGRRAGFLCEIDRARAPQLGINVEYDREQRQHQPELLRAGHAQFLDRPEERDSLLSRGADAGEPDHLAQRSRQYAGRHRRRPRTTRRYRGARQCGDLQARLAFRPTPTRRISSRSTRSMPASRAAISAASPPNQQDLAELKKELTPGNTIQVTGQIESMNDAFRNMASACCSPPYSSTC